LIPPQHVQQRLDGSLQGLDGHQGKNRRFLKMRMFLRTCFELIHNAKHAKLWGAGLAVFRVEK